MEDVAPIHLAAWFGVTEVIERLMIKGKYSTLIVKENGHDGRNTIHLAALNGHLETVKYLASFTDTPNQGDNIGITPIYTAIKTGHMDIVQYLAGLTDKYNPSALDIHFAVSYSHLDIVKFLVDFADEPNIHGISTLIYLAAIWGDLDMVKFLVKFTDTHSAPNGNGIGITPIQATKLNKQFEVVKFLEEHCKVFGYNFICKLQ